MDKYVLNHLLDVAHSLDGLSSERDKRRVTTYLLHETREFQVT